MAQNQVTITAYYRTCPFCKERIITKDPDPQGSKFILHVIEDCQVYRCVTIVHDSLPKTLDEFYAKYGEILKEKVENI